MIRTRVGYCGGTSPHPTYRNIGDHSEAIQMDFDPTMVSYQELLEIALDEGHFNKRGWPCQYRSAIFFRDEDQRMAAAQLGISEVEPLNAFTRAEDYHQKYSLQRSDFAAEFFRRYPDEIRFTDSPAVTKANAVAARHLDSARLEFLLSRLGVDETTARKMRRSAARSR